jgi:hypothetical protein
MGLARNRHTTIILKKKAGALSFWERKKDDILLQLLSAIISLLVGYFLGWFTHPK